MSDKQFLENQTKAAQSLADGAAAFASLATVIRTSPTTGRKWQFADVQSFGNLKDIQKLNINGITDAPFWGLALTSRDVTDPDFLDDLLSNQFLESPVYAFPAAGGVPAVRTGLSFMIGAPVFQDFRYVVLWIDPNAAQGIHELDATAMLERRDESSNLVLVTADGPVPT
jgi:hypothetical protein